MSVEWTTVTKQNMRRTAKGTKLQSKQKQDLALATVDLTKEWTVESKQLLVEQLYTYKAKLKETDFFKLVTTTLNDTPICPVQMVCYGIGNFGRPRSSPLWQLACAMNIWDALQLDYEEGVVKVYYFDPCATPMEVSILSDLGIHIIDYNELGKRNTDSTTTLFFMPHCPMLLYVNVMSENWTTLDNLLIFGNKISHYANRLGVDVPSAISLLLPFLKEEQMICSRVDVRDMEGDFECAFNDCYLTTILLTEGLPPRPEENSETIHDNEVLYS